MFASKLLRLGRTLCAPTYCPVSDVQVRAFAKVSEFTSANVATVELVQLEKAPREIGELSVILLLFRNKRFYLMKQIQLYLESII